MISVKYQLLYGVAITFLKHMTYDSNSISHCDLELLTYTENGLSFNLRHLTEGFKHQACSWKSHWETTGEL